MLPGPPHHDIAFEEEGWLQADAKLLGTRACNVTVGREEKAEMNQRLLRAEAAMQSGGARRPESEPCPGVWGGWKSRNAGSKRGPGHEVSGAWE